MNRKYKILAISDHALSVSGVGTQSRYLYSGLVSTGKYTVRALGAAIKHENYDTITVNPDFIIKPIDGFGTKEMIRLAIASERPDALFLFTDPRFFIHLFEMEEEIHSVCPIAYAHLWDDCSHPPEFNRVLYESTDLVNCINYPTYEMVRDVMKHKRVNYIPHALPHELFHPMPKEEALKFKRQLLPGKPDDEFVGIWVSRNARRKNPADTLVGWKMFVDQLEKKYGHRKATLIMHTDPLDQEGPNLYQVVDHLDVAKNVFFSKERTSFENMNVMYNISNFACNFSCFPGDELIITDTGYKPIKDINEGELVLTDKGRYRSVVRKSCRKTREQEGIYTIKSSNNQAVRVTGEHPVLAIKKEKVNFLINENINKLENLIEWVKVQDLKVNDYIIYQNRKLLDSKTQQIDLFQYVKDNNVSKRGADKYTVDDESIYWGRAKFRGKIRPSRYKRFVNLDEDLAYLLGLWVADGTTNSACFCLNGKTEEKLAIEVQEKIKRVFDKNCIYKNRSNRIGVIIEKSAVIAKFFTQECGSYSHHKHIPEIILNSTNELRRAFLEGYIAGDGCVLIHPTQGTQRNRCRTVSHHIAYDMKSLLVHLGYCPSMYYTENGGFTRDKIWTIEWNERKRKNNGSCRSWNVDGKFVVSRIYDIKHEPDEQCDVYNFEVEEDHTYATQGFTVHNCAEGFGLSTLEAMQCSKPIIAIKSGGGQKRQVVDWRDGSENGIALDPDVSTMVGSQMVPWILEDLVRHDTIANSFMKMYEFGPQERERLGQKARDYVLSEYVLSDVIKKWDETLEECILNWRKDYKPWECLTL